jgi:hypothetical protein
MKIHEYREMIKWLTRKPNVAVRKPSAVPPKTKTIQKFKKGGKPKPREENELERIARIQYEYMPEKTERPKHMDDKNIYSYEDREKFVKKIPVIPPKPDLVNGHSDWRPDDWLESIDPGGWANDKKVETNGLYDKYLELLKAGELLPGTSFQMFEKNYLDFDTDVISKINKKVLDQKRKEGLAAVIGVDPDKI